MANRYTRALKQLKSKSIDEKLELLSEIPTNSSGGLYVDVPGVYTTPPITNPIGVTGGPFLILIRMEMDQRDIMGRILQVCLKKMELY